jgi:TPR repeat protein
MNLAARPWIVALLAILIALSTATVHAGMTPEEVKAFEGFKALAERGDRTAQTNLGNCYYKAYGAVKDQVQAVMWWRKAADQGHAQAQFMLALCFDGGLAGVEKNAIEAYALYHLGSSFDDLALTNLAKLEKRMSRDEIAAGKKRVKDMQKEIDARTAAKAAGK